MKPVSVPIVPGQPLGRDVYGKESLYLFKLYDRASYFAEFGVQAPPCDPKRKMKRWFDSTAAGKYKAFGQDARGYPLICDLTLSPEEASTVNLPGKSDYPAYSPAPTTAVVRDYQGAPSQIDPYYLSTREEAFAMCAELGVDTVALSEVNDVGPFEVDWRGEARRFFCIGAQQEYVGQLLRLKYANGVGAPGHWMIFENKHAWVVDNPASEPASGEEVQVPVRDLLPDERIIVGFGGTPLIGRGDAQVELSPFTAVDRIVLNDLNDRVKALETLLGSIQASLGTPGELRAE